MNFSRVWTREVSIPTKSLHVNTIIVVKATVAHVQAFIISVRPPANLSH